MQASTIFELLLAACLIMLGLYIGFSESITIPGRVSMNTYHIAAPGTYFIAASMFCFASILLLLNLNKDKYKKICLALLVSSFTLITVGIVSGVS